MVLDDDELIELLDVPELVDRVVGYMEREGLIDKLFERVGQRETLGLVVVNTDDDRLNDRVLVELDKAVLERLGERETVVDGELESGTFTEIPINEDGTHEEGDDDVSAHGRAYTPNCIVFPFDG